ncbi:MAG: membrane protein insertion efficiency factor YidD [bacterium]
MKIKIIKILKKLIKLPAWIIMLMIRIYQFLFSFDHSFWSKYVVVKVCIYEPSCSEFTFQAIDKFGLGKGAIMGFFRILRCSPMQIGGYDPVPERFMIRREKSVK